MAILSLSHLLNRIYFLIHVTLKSKLYSLQNAFNSSMQGVQLCYFDFLLSVACGIPGPYPGQCYPSSSLSTGIRSNPFSILLHMWSLMVFIFNIFEIPGISYTAFNTEGKIVDYGLSSFLGVYCPCPSRGWARSSEFGDSISLCDTTICVSLVLYESLKLVLV